MELAESYIKFCIKYALDNLKDDMVFLDKRKSGLIDYLTGILTTPCKLVTYTEGMEILVSDSESGKVKFEEKPHWGIDLGSEHERYLCEKVFNGPIILYNYPKDIKAFYMRMNEDGKTVAAMDMLVPQIGELIGGSQREERLDKLDARIDEMKLDKKAYWWYRDLRRYGTVKHSGFGLGFERLIMMITGIDNIRDVIPYPRYPGHAEF